MIRMIYKDPSYKPDEKRQMIDGLYLDMTDTSKMANDLLRDIKKELGEK